MMRNRSGYIAIVLILAALMLSGCAKFKQIHPLSAKIESVVPYGLRSLVVNLKTEIDNPAPQITLTDISGSVERSGKILGRVVVDPFILKAKTQEEYLLRATITLDEGSTLFDVVSLANETALKECLVNVYFKASLKGGISKKMAYEGIPMESLMKM